MLTNLFRRRYLISLVYMLVVLIGFLAWRGIPLELAPDLSLPSITVRYSWGSASPEVMEQEVTRKVEQAVSRLRDVESIQSSTTEGNSSVTVRFNSRAPVDFRVVELQEYLTGLEAELPPSVRRGGISRRVPEELQDMENITWSLSGDRAVSDLLEFAEQEIRLPLLGIEGLDDIEITGAYDPALTVEFNTEALENLGLNPRFIMSEIRNNLQWRSSGYTERAGMRYSILIPPQFEGIDDIRSMRLQLPGSQRRIRLSDIASVAVLDYPAPSLRRINGSPALILSFIKESGADAIRMAEEIQRRMEAIRAELPSDMTLRLAIDSTVELREQFAGLQNQALISIIVVFLVLLVFIRRFRAPLVILGSIGFSVLMSLGVLYFIGYSLNMITLAGITVAIGMIIDNAVVVFEQVNPRLPARREDRLEHIKSELPRALVPVIGSTLTTVGIFIPLFFAMEELRIFLVPLAVALTLTMLSSVLIALSWIPYSLIWLVPSDTCSEQESSSKKSSGNTAGAGSKEDSLFHRRLRRPFLVLFAWRHKLRWIPYIAFFIVLGIPLFAIETPAWEDDTAWPEFTRIYFDNRNDIDPLIGGLTYRFFNDTYFGSPWGGFSQQQRININITVPQGTPIDEIDKMARNFEAIAAPYREAFTFFDTRVSEYSGASLTFHIDNDYLVRPEPYIYYAEAMYLAARTGNSSISVSGLGEGMYTGSIGGGISGQRITLRGYNYQQLLDIAMDLERRLRQNRRVQAVDIHGTGSYGGRGDLYQYVLDLNEEELAVRGLSRGELNQALALDLDPTNSGGRVEMDGRQLVLIGRNDSRTTYDEEVFREKRLSAEGQVFSLEQVASMGREQSQSSIQREDQQYRRVVTVDFLGPYQLANSFIEGVVNATPVPVGSSIQYGGGFFSSGSDDSVRNLMVVLAMSLLAVWMIVSALLESWIDPLIVILAVPLSLIGIMAGTLWHDLAFDRGAIAGTLLCVGVVVNNSILLMHEKERFRSLGVHGFRSWLYVYRNKMRAVLITTLTTIGGLIPMIIFGDNELWQQLATVTCWGLGGSTLLLLLLMGIWEGNGKRET